MSADDGALLDSLLADDGALLDSLLRAASGGGSFEQRKAEVEDIGNMLVDLAIASLDAVECGDVLLLISSGKAGTRILQSATREQLELMVMQAVHNAARAERAGRGR